jgi:hypothetical protein
MTENKTKYITNNRRKQINKSQLNGIDYIDVVTPDLTNNTNHRPYLIIYFFKKLTTPIDENNIKIEGGVKIKNIRAEWVKNYHPELTLPNIHTIIDKEAQEKALIIYPTNEGDFSTYTLRIVNSTDSNNPPTGFDLILSNINFSFKIDYPSKFDCKITPTCPQEIPQEPVIDYLSKDYTSFRNLILGRLDLLIPNWKERNTADMGIMMAELLSYVGDYLSYYQDAVATEAYLGTSRNRISVKRHARLLGYYMHSGCNARAWICIETNNPKNTIHKKTKFLTGTGKGNIGVYEEDLEEEIAQGTKIFEAMHDLTIYKTHNTIQFYTWGNSNPHLPEGSTQATLWDSNGGNEPRTLDELKIGDVLIFEENPSENSDDKNIAHRHAVRLTKIKRDTDELDGTHVVNIEWGLDDALPFTLYIDKAVAHGNVLLADHGLSLEAEKLEDPNIRLNFRPCLKQQPLTFRGPFDPATSASSAFNYALQDVKADIYLKQLKEPLTNKTMELKETNWVPGNWTPKRDLFSSNKFETNFVVETENDGTTIIRFGDGTHGLNPQKKVGEAPELLYGFYRVGNGTEGNVGAESIKRILYSETVEKTTPIRIRNPMPAKGGVDPESIDSVRQNAPEATKINERAITNADYANIIKQKCNDIQSAVAKTRWTGSWYTIHVMVNRFGRKPVDEDFKIKLRTILNQYRLSGYDIEIDGPRYVPLEIEITVIVSPNTYCEELEKTLLENFSNRILSNGLKGFFHPDNFTFGQPIFLSALTTVISKIDGVISFSVKKFKRADREANNRNEGIIEISPYEIIQLDNDVNYPENGQITFTMQGGR